MAVTRTDDNGNVIYITDPNGNEIGRTGKITAGILLVVTTVFTMILLVAHWPDKMPPLDDKATTKYAYKWFAVTYLDSAGISTAGESVLVGANMTIPKAAPDTTAKGTNNGATAPAADSPGKPAVPAQPGTGTAKNETASKPGAQPPSAAAKTGVIMYQGRKIDINILILLLVGLSGFLGNLIHIAASFTNFVGAGKFRRSWILWYCVKPFTAAALAVGVYIIFRAGFLNSGNVAASVNLYGVIALAILAGLYTDMATQKLKEIFAVVFQTALARPNPLDYPPLKITSADPNPLPLGEEKRILLSGIGFDNRPLKFKINGTEIKDVVINPNSIAFTYKAETKNPELAVYDERGVEVTKYILLTAGDPATSTVTAVDPTSIAVDTDETITLTGTGLDAAGITITMGGAPVTPASTSATEIKFTYKAEAAGDIELLVSAADDSEIKKQTITVTAADTAPATSTVTAIDPPAIAVGTEETITLTGTGLDAEGIKITMGGQPVTPTSTSATEIKFTYKAAAAGDIELLVSAADDSEIKKQTITAS